MRLHSAAGQLPQDSDLVNLKALLRAFHEDEPDAYENSHRIAFGTSGHRGTSLSRSFNRSHIMAMSQAICTYRKSQGISGPLFLGFDTHALSRPAFEVALEVFAANDVEVHIDKDLGYTPTPVISHAILKYNRGRNNALADGVVITPSHNPPQDGGFKYNPPHGGPAGKDITDAIQNEANEHLEMNLRDVLAVSFDRALNAPTTKRYDYVNAYVDDLENVIDFDVIRKSNLKLAVDPLGGAGVAYWQPIADRYQIDLTILNDQVDTSFAFMTRDWDGKIRMDPSSHYAMASVLEKAKAFDLTFACDTDHDRHGIVTKTDGLMAPNHFLAVCISYLYTHRPKWPSTLKIGKTLVSSEMIDRVAKKISREVFEVPVGFKWFVDGLIAGELGFVGEESAGATFLRKDGRVWTTDKDGFIPCLLAAEMTARLGKNPSELYRDLTAELGTPVYSRLDSPTTTATKKKVTTLSSENLTINSLGGDPIKRVMTKASGNQASIGGIKIETARGWIAARPSGTEDILKIYGESFAGSEHLEQLFKDAQSLTQS